MGEKKSRCPSQGGCEDIGEDGEKTDLVGGEGRIIRKTSHTRRELRTRFGGGVGRQRLFPWIKARKNQPAKKDHPYGKNKKANVVKIQSGEKLLAKAPRMVFERKGV